MLCLFGVGVSPLLGRRVGFHSVNLWSGRLSDPQVSAKTDEKRTASFLASVQNLPIATVGDVDRFVTRGGLIGFIWVGLDIRFDVNLDAAGPARLRISSPLLSLAKKVTGVAKGN